VANINKWSTVGLGDKPAKMTPEEIKKITGNIDDSKKPEL
jgi:hypothetical protein